MSSKDVEHAPLLVTFQKEEAAPREQALEGTAEGHPPHVRDDPFVLGKTLLAESDQRGRREGASELGGLARPRGHEPPRAVFRKSLTSVSTSSFTTPCGAPG